MINIILEFILLGITWGVIVSSTPYQVLTSLIEEKLIKPTSDANRVVITALNCALCSGTWLSILYAILTASNPLLIALTPFVAEITYRKINTF